MNETEQKLNIELQRSGKLQRAGMRKVMWQTLRPEKQKEYDDLRDSILDKTRHIPKDEYFAAHKVFDKIIIERYDEFFYNTVAYFHCFLMRGEDTIAMVELESGNIVEKQYYQIQFVS